MAKYTAEPIPQDTLSALLTKNWISFKEMPRPEIVVANDPEDAISRFNTGDGDYIIISQGGPEIIKYRGNVQYYDRAFPLTAELYSKKDRQRIRDMWWQFKGIIFDHLFGFQGYQIIRLKSYTEMVNGNLNIWKAEIKISVESAGVCIDTAGDYDRYNS